LRQVPTRFYAFDVLELDGRDITSRPYIDRRETLNAIADASAGNTVQFPCNLTDTDPALVLEAAAELNLEGIVCKHLGSPYTPGLRSRDWIKTPHRKRSEFIVGGWLPGMGPNHQTVGAVLVGAYRDSELIFCGCVGAGLGETERRRLTEYLKPLQRRTSPFESVPAEFSRHARWV
jgi:bifunctional non-homologous end joining protein LigD